MTKGCFLVASLAVALQLASGCQTSGQTGAPCQVESDCSSAACVAGTCQAPGCFDGILNGMETDLDCGGKCRPCADGLNCLRPIDCQSGICGLGNFSFGARLKCQSPTCIDGRQNGDETDVDCGGLSCKACAPGDRCRRPEDCKTASCVGGICLCTSNSQCTIVNTSCSVLTHLCGVCASTLECGPGEICSQATGCFAACPSPTANPCAPLTCDAFYRKCIDLRCSSDGDCRSPQRCDTTVGMCVAFFCRGPVDCAPKTCDPITAKCVECIGDGDCHGASPRCDLSSHRCVACLPADDRCPPGSYCHLLHCVAGCKDDLDCRLPAAVNADGGLADGGLTDGGLTDGGFTDGGLTDGGLTDGAIADGGSPDGGAFDGGAIPPAAAFPYCQLQTHQCVMCLTDGDCEAGKVCLGNVCTYGCTASHACPSPFACCGSPLQGYCANIASDAFNCGACDNACLGGWTCCDGACTSPVSDVFNCGACGNACSVANATPKCAFRSCAIATCDPGYRDCNGATLDGCETHSDDNVNNCGGCNNSCQLLHATPRCVAGQCEVDSCLFPYADCDLVAATGCEVNLSGSDPMNCGACGLVCPAGMACNQGACN